MAVPNRTKPTRLTFAKADIMLGFCIYFILVFIWWIMCAKLHKILRLSQIELRKIHKLMISVTISYLCIGDSFFEHRGDDPFVTNRRVVFYVSLISALRIWLQIVGKWDSTFPFSHFPTLSVIVTGATFFVQGIMLLTSGMSCPENGYGYNCNHVTLFWKLN